MRLIRKPLLILIALFSFIGPLKATHIMGAEITYELISKHKYKMKFSFYRDCLGIAMPSWPVNLRCLDKSITQSMGSLSTSTRVISDITPVCKTANSCGGSLNQAFSSKGVERHDYFMTLDFTTGNLKKFVNQGCCWLRIETMQNARNGAITTGPSGTVYTYLDLNLCAAPKNSPPKFFTSPIVYLCCNQPAHLSFGAIDDVDGDSLSYQWGKPHRGYNQTVQYSGSYAYNQPVKVYYPGSLKYPYSNPTANPPIGLYLDSITGDLVFTPTKCDEVSVMVLEVREWRLDSASQKMKPIGLYRRDIQVETSSCPANNVPRLIGGLSDSAVASVCDSAHTFYVETYDTAVSSTKRNDTLSISLKYTPTGVSVSLVDSSAKHPTMKVEIQPYLLPEKKKDVHLTFEIRDNACPYNAVYQKTWVAKFKKNFQKVQTRIQVFEDLNNDTKLDTNESLMSGRRVMGYLKDSIEIPILTVNSADPSNVAICHDTSELKVRLMPHPFFKDNRTDTTFEALADSLHVLSFGTNWKKGTIGGVLYGDLNKNCQIDQEDKPLANRTILANPGKYSTTTDQNGRYLFELPNGNYTIGLPESKYEVQCKKIAISCHKDSSKLTADLLIKADTGNVKISMFHAKRISLNRAFYNNVYVDNRSRDTLKDLTCFVKFPAKASVTAKTLNSHGGGIYSFKATVLPRSRFVKPLRLKFSSSNFKAGNYMDYSVWFTDTLRKNQNYFTQDDSSGYYGLFRNSYDPNIKWTSQDSIITPLDSSLTYTVEFQNTGNAPAHYVEIRDTLSSLLDWSSFEFLNSKHQPVEALLFDGVIYFVFDDIVLMDSASDEEASKGWVQYKINLKEAFKIDADTSIDNSASIYFDLNPPIKTNTHRNTVKSPITVNPLTKKEWCSGDTIIIDFFTRYTPEKGNTFLLWISDEKGDFTSKTQVGSIASTDTSGVFAFVVPSTLVSGTGYRFMVTGSTPDVEPFKLDVSNSVALRQTYLDTLLQSSLSKCYDGNADIEVINKKANTYRLFVNNVAIDTNSIGIWSKVNVQNGDEVFVEVSDQGFCATNSDTNTFVFFKHPNAGFILDTLYCGTQTINIEDTSKSDDAIGTYEVFWGDGSSDSYSALTTESHSFGSYGSYQVELKLETNNGCRDSVTHSVTVGPYPDGSFSLPSAICESDSFQLSHSSTILAGTIDSIHWEVDDIEAIDNAWEKKLDGLYKVALFLMSDLGCGDTTSSNIQVYENPKANFNLNVLNACIHENQVEMDLDESNSLYAITSQSWDYAIGTSTSSSLISVTYPATGQYTVSVMVEDENGCQDTDTQDVTIIDYLASDFELNALEQCINENLFLPINYDDGTSLIGATHQWEFDGLTETTTDFSHSFTAIGTHTITHLTAVNGNCYDTTELTVNVLPNPEVDFSVVPICQGEDAVFTNQADNTGLTIDEDLWDLEVNQQDFTTEQTSVTETFINPGTFTITQVKGSNGCYDTLSKPLEVLPNPLVEVGYTTGESGLEIVFQNKTTGGGQSTWDFGDGTGPQKLTETLVTHTYENTGKYTVKLVEVSPDGCSDSINVLVDAIGEVIFIVPNAFTPNNDGINDEFHIVDPELIETLNIRLYNRWGALVHEGIDKNEPLAGSELPTGLYVYEIVLIDINGMKHYLQGDLRMVR